MSLQIRMANKHIGMTTTHPPCQWAILQSKPGYLFDIHMKAIGNNEFVYVHNTIYPEMWIAIAIAIAKDTGTWRRSIGYNEWETRDEKNNA